MIHTINDLPHKLKGNDKINNYKLVSNSNEIGTNEFFIIMEETINGVNFLFHKDEYYGEFVYDKKLLKKHFDKNQIYIKKPKTNGKLN
jgi:hypothetical protein